MKRIITLLMISCSSFILSACSQSTWLYRVNVQQGNIITIDMLNSVKMGMSKENVCERLGPPILSNAFNQNRWTYVYTLKPSRGKFVQRKLILYFAQDRVIKILTQNCSPHQVTA